VTKTDTSNSRRVLVVEDEAIIALMIEDMLIELGHEVVATVGKVAQAAKVFAQGVADFAVLDVNLGGEQSFSFASMLREEEIPFVFATGYGTSGLPVEWQGTPTLQKPFLARDLKAAMQAAIAVTTASKSRTGE
jgi:CheY-like chemotaxis protein